ncbi:PspC domain-containing protein [Micromonospora sp. WMMD730]|uniref:PspC domain-containing protein n=1 Tax=Micromonospora sp. WMMD730 TaxID=3404128 RepID=UPI003B958BE1
MTSTSTPHAPYKQLRRPTTDRMVAGVASGIGRYFAVDPTLVRVLFAVATLLTGGVAALAYPIMWFLMPEEPAGAPAWPHPADPTAQPQPTWPTPAEQATWPQPGGPATWPQPGGPATGGQPQPPATPPTAG